jgi:hypothetical protein
VKTPIRLGTESDFAEARLSFLERMPRVARLRPEYADDFYPFTYAMPREELATHNTILDAIARGVHELVTKYETHKRIRATIPLPEATREQLASLHDVPLGTVYLRPDFIYDEHGTPRICEIGTRFPFNGFYMSAFANQALPANKQLPGLTRLQRDLAALAKEKIVIVKNHEPGYDIHYLRHYTNAPTVASEALPRDGIAISELHEFEIEQQLATITARMLEGLTVTNDPRVVLIGHDKRLLALLCDNEFMSPLIGTERAATLNKHIIPTYVSGQTVPSEAYTNPPSFVAKIAKSGKTQGFQIGNKSEGWRRALDERGYAVQPRIEQPYFALWDPLMEQWNNWHLAGTLYTGAQHYGPGLLRAFNDTVTKMAALVQPSVQE